MIKSEKEIEDMYHKIEDLIQINKAMVDGPFARQAEINYDQQRKYLKGYQEAICWVLNRNGYSHWCDRGKKKVARVDELLIALREALLEYDD